MKYNTHELLIKLVLILKIIFFKEKEQGLVL